MQNNLLNIKNILRAETYNLAKEFNVKSIEVFGSYTKGEQTEKSDIDLLVTFTSTPSLLKFIALENYLSELLHSKVDLVMKNSIKQRLRKNILSESVKI
ncbi:MAG: nucleotidyltransferase family protein [Chlorobi bacterium]|nr:nucleotidyltransferase family protein [Chlorobiota bacterium]